MDDANFLPTDLAECHRLLVMAFKQTVRLEQQAAAIDKTFDYLLSRLRINVPGFVETLVSSL